MRDSPHTKPEDEEVARLCKALAHPVRVAIVRALLTSGTCCCGQIVGRLPLAQSTVSQHLKVLREAGIVSGESEGQRCCYGIDAAALDRLIEALASLRAAAPATSSNAA